MWPAQWYWGHCRELESQLVGYNSFCLRVCVALMFAKTYWVIKSYLTAFTSASPACIINFVFYIHYLHFLGYHITKWAVTCCILIFLKVAKTKAGVCCEMWKWLYRHFYACITVCWECSTIILLVIWVNLCFVFVLHIFILYFETVLDSFVSFWKHQVNSDLKWNICEYSYLFINIYSKATMFNVVIYLLHPSKASKQYSSSAQHFDFEPVSTSKPSLSDLWPWRLWPLPSDRLSHQARISASVQAMKILDTGTEVEAAVADALVRMRGTLDPETPRCRWDAMGLLHITLS